ncbi:MAG: hypothetical protein ACRDT6_22160 [Micromonosporaceae bacterium]
MKQRPKTVQVVAVPYGGAREVAALDLKHHTRNPWTGRCRCGEPFATCHTRQQAIACLTAESPA